MEQEKITLAKCGMNCTRCRFAEENDCPGCPYCRPVSEREKLFEDEECEVGKCAEAKGYDSCGQCPEFPCEILKEVSFDVETGDGGNRLMRLKELRDGEYRRKRLRISAPVTGGCLGLLAGTIIGCITGEIFTMPFGGTAAGVGLGFIAAVSKGDRR